VSSPYGNSVWNEGAAAARAGVPSSRNPYQPTNYNFVVWLNGWAFAAHQRAKEMDDEEL
jgi:hypothetical protein